MIRLRMIAGCLLLLVGGLQVWTQYRAYHYRYHPALGTPVWQVQAFSQRHALYVPWAVLGWAWQWDGTRRRLQIVGGGVASGTLLRPHRPVSAAATRRQRTSPTADAGAWHHDLGHQEGRAAVEAVCPARAGARELPGEGAPLRWPGECAPGRPQRAGKGTGIIIPSLLELEEHTVVIDVRGETWRDTAGHRRTFSRCLKLALTQPGSVRFNPLLEIRKGTSFEFMDAAMLGEMVITGGHNKADFDHWERTAKSLITCGMLYEVHTRRVPTLAHLARFWSQPGRTILSRRSNYRADGADAPGGRAGAGSDQQVGQRRLECAQYHDVAAVSLPRPDPRGEHQRE